MQPLMRDQAAAPGPPAIREGLPDYIYQRFFKAGIFVVLTAGCTWGAVNLLEIGLAGSFLQMRLLPAIHAHAHAMVFGWVGLFVMGFAYQSFPRPKASSVLEGPTSLAAAAKTEASFSAKAIFG